MDLNLTTQPNRRPRRSPHQLIHRPDGTVEVIVCHRGGASRFFGDSLKETLNRAKSYEASLRHNTEQLY